MRMIQNEKVSRVWHFQRSICKWVRTSRLPWFLNNQMVQQVWPPSPWTPKSLSIVTAAMKLKDANSLEVMTNLDSILKRRDITLQTNVPIVKAMIFPVFMYGCESWIIKKAERQRIDAFELWCWRRLLRVPWTGVS